MTHMQSQQVEVKRYDSSNVLINTYVDEVVIPELTEYPDLKTQLRAEQWNLSLPSDQKLDDRTRSVLFETKKLDTQTII